MQNTFEETNEELLAFLRDEIQVKIKNQNFSDEFLMFEAMKERVSFVKDFIDNCTYFYEGPAEYDQTAVEKKWKPDTPDQLINT